MVRLFVILLITGSLLCVQSPAFADPVTKLERDADGPSTEKSKKTKKPAAQKPIKKSKKPSPQQTPTKPVKKRAKP